MRQDVKDSIADAIAKIVAELTYSRVGGVYRKSLTSRPVAIVE